MKMIFVMVKQLKTSEVELKEIAMAAYKTITEASEDLKKRGYSID